MHAGVCGTCSASQASEAHAVQRDGGLSLRLAHGGILGNLFQRGSCGRVAAAAASPP